MSEVRYCLLLLTCAMGPWSTSFGAEGTDAAAETDPSSSLEQRVIVLVNGRVISGEIEDRPGGYLIDNAIGQMVIPYAQVRLTATDLPDAYRKLKASIKEPTAGAHVSLGQWCFDNRLFDSAREQVKAALILEPERKEARQLLKRIEQMTLGDALEASIPTPPAKSRDGFETSPAVALDGLSHGVTQDFVRRVQPLLMNKCGNAQCHGTAAESNLRLAPVRLGSSGFRSLTDQNLSTILQYIDAAHPRQSTLLVVSQGSHGGKGPIWTGPRADEQIAELRAWVTRVAFEHAPGATARSNVTTDQKASAQGGQDPLLQQILAEERPDPFDPAIFNERIHGRP